MFYRIVSLEFGNFEDMDNVWHAVATVRSTDPADHDNTRVVFSSDGETWTGVTAQQFIRLTDESAKVFEQFLLMLDGLESDSHSSWVAWE